LICGAKAARTSAPEIGKAVRRIVSEYETFRQGALKSYEHQYRFYSKFAAPLDRINGLANRRRAG
jgi:hypothetical protein